MHYMDLTSAIILFLIYYSVAYCMVIIIYSILFSLASLHPAWEHNMCTIQLTYSLTALNKYIYFLI